MRKLFFITFLWTTLNAPAVFAQNPASSSSQHQSQTSSEERLHNSPSPSTATIRFAINPATSLLGQINNWAPAPFPEEFPLPPIMRPGQTPGEPTGQQSDAYAAPPSSPKIGRATIELAAALGIGAVWYWSNTDLNGLDWQYQWTLESQLERHKNFGGWRFDDNSLHLNSPGHPLAGASYYALARSNNFSRTGSFVAAMLTSLAWEALVEYKEVVSLNDMVFTGIAAVPLGEAYHQLGRFFQNSRPTALNTTLAWIFGAPSQFHRWLDGTAPEEPAVYDSLFGWPDNLWHRFALSIGAALTPPRTSEISATNASQYDETDDTYHYGVELRLTSEIIDIPEVFSPTRASSWQTGSLITQLDLAGTFSSDAVTDFFLNTKLTLAGYFRQSIVEDAASGKPYGYAMLLGTSIAYRHTEYDFPDFRDRLGAVHFPGLSFNLRLLFGDFTLRINADTHPDFAAVQSTAFPAYSRLHSTEQTRTVLRDHGYYYAFGFSRHYRIEASYGAFTLRTNFSRQDFDSIEGHDRNQPDITNDISLTDHVMTRDSSLEITLPWGHLTRLGITSQHRYRSGTVDQTTASLSDHRLLARLILGF